VTASYDIAMHDLAIHSAITVDMRPPLIDVGRCPDSSEPTIVGQPAPERLPYVRPVAVLPHLDVELDENSVSIDDRMSDVAANVCGETKHAYDDLWALCGSGQHVRFICELLGRRELELDTMTERVANLGATVQTLQRQLSVQQSLGAEYQAKFDRSDKALADTTAELYAERNNVVHLDVLLRTERQRLEREGSMHRETVNRLIKQTADSCKMNRALKEAEALRLAALEDCEQMRAINVSLSEEIVTTRLAMAQLAQTLHDVRTGKRQ